MTNSPKLAIVISCYNYEVFVERAIRSVTDQNRMDCELVVVDDGSTDASWDVISRCNVTAYRIANGGQRTACLYGFDRTTAPFVLFLDADDELKPGSLEAIISLLDPQVAKVQFGLTVIDADGTPIADRHWNLDRFRSREALAREVLRRGVYKTPPTSGNVFRRDLCALLREAIYDRPVDGIILFAAPFFGDVVSVPDELGRYRIHGHNDSGLGRAPEADMLQREIDRFLARSKHLSAVLQRQGQQTHLTPPERTFYFRERSFYLAIAAGRRPLLRAVPGLVRTMWSEPFSLKNKFAIAVLFGLAAVLPDERRKRLLAYRLKAGPRSAIGFLKQIVRP